jgi:hypothetical protein
MAEDLLDYWVRLIRTAFPANAWINASFSNNDHLIQIDWKLHDDLANPAKRSRKIEITIKEGAIDDYLDKTRQDRELSDIMLKDFVCRQYHQFLSQTDLQVSPYASPAKWLISREVLNSKPAI